MYPFLDIFFTVFHTVLTLFNLLGWIWRPTRRWNLLSLGLTFFSWVILGFWYGFGYCFCTHWHWKVRWRMGLDDMPNSYIKFLLDRLTGLNWNAAFVDAATLILFVLALAASLYTNIRDWRSS